MLWNLATLVGALAGDSLGDPRTYGLDAAVSGAFLALLWPRLDSTRNRVAAVLGAAVALCVVPLTPSGVPVLAASVVAVGMALMARDDQPCGGAVIWLAVLACGVGCYLLKLAGMSVPEWVLATPGPAAHGRPVARRPAGGAGRRTGAGRART